MVQKPFGTWDSPVSAATLAGRRRLNDVQWDTDGRTLLWSESRGGSGALVAQPAGEAPLDLMGELSVRGGIQYGGGEFATRSGMVIFSASDGRLYTRTLGMGAPRPITPAYGVVASPAISPDQRWVAYVHSEGKTDLLAVVDSEGSDWPVQLARGADFYMQPVWSPDGKMLAWVEWDYPNMPWDHTRLMLARVDGMPPRITELTTIAGSEGSMNVQPEFSPDGRYLAYIAEQGEWETMNLLDIASGQTRNLVEGDGLQISTPAWVQGTRTYGWAADNRSLYYLNNQRGFTSLWQVDLDSGTSRQLDSGPYTYLAQLSVSVQDELACIASAPGIPDRIVRRDHDHHWRVVSRSAVEDIDPAYLPQFAPVEWTGLDGQVVYGIYSPPTNPNFEGQGLPPAIINVHGGPTAQAVVKYSADAAYFTSRGWGWLEVNYRGSTGYGRQYRLALNEHWGELDVRDTVSGAQFLASSGRADGKRLVVRGGSAGGYTVLNALAQYPGSFKAGICLYGVSNLFTVDIDTDKFEQRYNESLVGALPEASQRYYDWSPVFHASQIREPLAVFQGEDDRSVPASQSEEIVAALRANHVPHVYRLYPGEGHGFRKPETIRDLLKTVDGFLRQYVLFTV